MEEFEEWKQQRILAVTSPTGWLTVCGLFWLSPGVEYNFGSAPDSHILLPADKSPRVGGTLKVENDNSTTTLTPASGAIILINGVVETLPVELHNDLEGAPTVVGFENSSVVFFIIKRSNKIAVRVRDEKSDQLTHFKGLELYPYGAQNTVTAKFIPHNKIIKVPNVLDDIIEYHSPGVLEFKWIDGKNYSLDTVLETQESKRLWVIFKDATSGHDTYPMRFLYTKLPHSGNMVILDFNFSFNPACAFTDFAACPLAPKQNVLPFKIEAGEKKYTSSSH